MADENSTPDNVEVKPAWYWVKDARGYGSVTTTLVFVSFWVTTLTYLASTFVKIGNFEIRSFDAGACSAYFIPILTLYFGRKFTDAKFNVGGSLLPVAGKAGTVPPDAPPGV